MREIDRRRFLGVLPGAAIVAGGLSELGRETPGAEGWKFGTTGRPVDGDAGGERGPAPTGGPEAGARAQASSAIGVQLYTLRSVMASDPAGTLAALAEIGYEEVELAGLYGMSAGGMKAMLDAAGLRAASSHQSVEEVRGSWEATLEAAVALGQSLIVVPSIPVAERDGNALARVADDFNRAGEAARAAGLRFGYHNHDWEMRPGTDRMRPMDLLLDRTDPGLVDWQMDIFWTVHGGTDPMAATGRARGPRDQRPREGSYGRGRDGRRGRGGDRLPGLPGARRRGRPPAPVRGARPARRPDRERARQLPGARGHGARGRGR